MHLSAWQRYIYDKNASLEFRFSYFSRVSKPVWANSAGRARLVFLPGSWPPQDYELLSQKYRHFETLDQISRILSNCLALFVPTRSFIGILFT